MDLVSSYPALFSREQHTRLQQCRWANCTRGVRVYFRLVPAPYLWLLFGSDWNCKHPLLAVPVVAQWIKDWGCLYERAGSSPGLTAWVKGPELLWLWRRKAAAAPIWPLALEHPYATDVEVKRKKEIVKHLDLLPKSDRYTEALLSHSGPFCLVISLLLFQLMPRCAWPWPPSLSCELILVFWTWHLLTSCSWNAFLAPSQGLWVGLMSQALPLCFLVAVSPTLAVLQWLPASDLCGSANPL